MELHEQISSLTSANKQYKDLLENTNAEKLAIDQLLVETLKSSLSSKKEIILKDENIRKLNVEIETLKKEKEALENKILSLTAARSESEITL